MNISGEVAALAVRKVFSAAVHRGSGSVDLRSLNRLWDTTGLRREDLVAGVRLLTESGWLRSDEKTKDCNYVIARGPDAHGCGEQLPADPQTAEAEAILAYIATRARNNSRVVQGRRRGDTGRAAAQGESRNPQQNRLLMCLRNLGSEYLDRHLKLVRMPAGQVLWEPGDKLPNVYFPVDCIVSIIHEMEDGGSCEIAIVGNEGAADFCAVMSDECAVGRAMVETAGYAYRLPAFALRQAFESSNAVRDLLLRYFRFMLLQTAQLGACNRHHTIDQQLSRLLLSTVDRVPSNRISTTHERLSALIGVRREGITEAIGRLKKAGLIQCERGAVVILNHEGLRSRSCECYTVLKSQWSSFRPNLAGSTGQRSVAARPRNAPEQTATNWSNWLGGEPLPR